MFEPPSAEDLLPDVREAVRHFGHVEERAGSWLALAIHEHWPPDPAVSIIRLPDARERLTAAGRALGTQGFTQTVTRACMRWRLAKDYGENRRYLAAQTFFGAAEVHPNPNQGACAAMAALPSNRFTVAQELPPLPLAACDRDICLCGYRLISFPELERETK